MRRGEAFAIAEGAVTTKAGRRAWAVSVWLTNRNPSRPPGDRLFSMRKNLICRTRTGIVRGAFPLRQAVTDHFH